MDNPIASAAESWLELYRQLIHETSLSDGIKGYLLKIDEQPLDRTLLPHVRENFALRQRLLRAIVQGCGEACIFNALHALANKAL